MSDLQVMLRCALAVLFVIGFIVWFIRYDREHPIL